MKEGGGAVIQVSMYDIPALHFLGEYPVTKAVTRVKCEEHCKNSQDINYSLPENF